MSGADTLLLRAFCSQFKEFCADLIRVFPQDVDIRAATGMLIQLCNGNPRLLLTVFRERIAVPYGATIAKGDLGFFVDKDYTTDVAGMKFANVDYILKKIDMLRRPIMGLDEKSKQLVIEYFQNLCRLSLASNS